MGFPRYDTSTGKIVDGCYDYMYVPTTADSEINR